MVGGPAGYRVPDRGRGPRGFGGPARGRPDHPSAGPLRVGVRRGLSRAREEGHDRRARAVPRCSTSTTARGAISTGSTTAQLLTARGRDQEAWVILRADHPSITISPFPTAVLWVLLRGRVAERLGDRETALRSYAWVAGMWQHADSALAPYASEARERLARLSAEPR